MHPRVLSRKGWAIVRRLNAAGLLESWTLAGGTGLALQLGHRTSEDLHFFRHPSPDPDPLLSYFSSILKDDGFLFFHTPNIKIQLPKVRLKKALKGMRPGEHYLEARDHMNIYSSATIERVLRRTGFRQVQFIHLHPVQSVAGNRSPLLRGLKNLWFGGARALHHLTLGKINLDNLFVVARK